MADQVVRDRIEAHIRDNDLIEAGGPITCLVSGGADSTCLWHALTELGYDVSALHVNHRLRGDESEADADFCRDVLGAEVVVAVADSSSEAVLREARYALRKDRLRATGHTASDQVETILYRLVSSGTTRGLRSRRADGVVRPLLTVWRRETVDYCRSAGIDFRVDSTNPSTMRGRLRDEVLPLLAKIHPAAERNVLAAAEDPERLPRPIERGVGRLLESRSGSMRLDLGAGVTAVREYDELWLERSAVRLDGPVRWGGWRIEARVAGLHVRPWRAGDRLADGGRKVQELFVEARVPRSARDAWPLVVRGDDVVAVPGVATAPGYEDAVTSARTS